MWVDQGYVIYSNWLYRPMRKSDELNLIDWNWPRAHAPMCRFDFDKSEDLDRQGTTC